MNLRQPGFTYSACGPFTKNKERIQKLKEIGGSRYIYQNELDKACFQHSMVYGDFKDLTRRTASDKILRNKAINIAKNLNMMDINVDLLQWSINFLIKRLQVVPLHLHGWRLQLRETNLLLKMKICQTKSSRKKETKQLLENSRKEKYTHFLWTIFRVLILLICN